MTSKKQKILIQEIQRRSELQQEYLGTDKPVNRVKPLVSVGVVTYQHADFIRECLDGILMQETTFPFEVLVGEDESTDGTREICIEYAECHPDRIRLFLRDRRLSHLQYGNRDLPLNCLWTRQSARGKYIAPCEGDDYWTDPAKLETQVNLLETRPEFPLCFHPVWWLDQETGKMTKTYYGAPGVKSVYSLDDLLEYSNFIPTASVMYRNDLFGDFPDWWFRSPVGDFPLHVLNLCHSKSEVFGMIDQVMAVYRRHSGGVHGGKTVVQNRARLVTVYRLLGEHLNLRNRPAWKRGISRRYIELCAAHGAQRKLCSSIRAAFLSMWSAPTGFRREAMREVASLLAAFDHRPLRFAKRAISKLRRKGIVGFCAAVVRRVNRAVFRWNGAGPPSIDKRLVSQQKRIGKSLRNGEMPDRIRRSLDFTESLADETPYHYRYSYGHEERLLYASTYAAMLRHLLSGPTSVSVRHRTDWADYINQFQCDDGLYRDSLLQNEIAETEDWWGWRHLTAHVVTALTGLGHKPARQFRFLQPLFEHGAAKRWLAELPWRDRPDFVSNTVMNFGVLLQYERDFFGNVPAGQAMEEVFEYLDESQDGDTGLWGNLPARSPRELSVAVQTAYHLWNLYFYDRRPIRYIERAIDSCLATQNCLGGFGVRPNSSACEDIDSIDPLCRFAALTDYRRGDIHRALEKALRWILVNQMEDGGFVFRRFERFAYGHELMTTDAEESNLFATWFRSLAIAYVANVVDIPALPADGFHWAQCPGYQFWHQAPSRAEDIQGPPSEVSN